MSAQIGRTSPRLTSLVMGAVLLGDWRGGLQCRRVSASKEIAPPLVSFDSGTAVEQAEDPSQPQKASRQLQDTTQG